MERDFRGPLDEAESDESSKGSRANGSVNVSEQFEETENLSKATQGGQLDIDDLKSMSLRRCFSHFVCHMEPNAVLDIFEEENAFSSVTNQVVRDIRECDNTSNKNRTLLGKIQSDPAKYGLFKEALTRTGQTSLVHILQGTETAYHDECKLKGAVCPCSGSDYCEALREIRCSVSLLPYVSQATKALRQDLINLYLERCTQVPVYPLEPSVTESVDKLYVTPIMEQVIGGCNKTKTASYSDRDNPQRKRIQGYRDIFYSNGQRCKNVYITGEAGVGKTTFCENIVHTWCSAHLKKDRTGDEQLLAEFTLLFYISLRSATDETTVEQMIENQLEIKNVSQLMERESCLIILDGLDEWVTREEHHSSRFVTKGLPGRKLKGNFTILTTSRPWKLEVLRLKEAEIDKQIHIAGFSDYSLDTLVCSVTQILNERYDEQRRSRDFDELVEENGLSDLTQTPVLLMQMLCLWHSGNSIGHSQCDIYSSIIDRQLEYAEMTKEIQIQGTESHNSMPQFPRCLNEKSNAETYSALLYALSKLAFHLLCSGTKESSLVFSHKQMEIHGLSKEQLEYCLKIGLLTQHKVCGKVTEKLKSVSFVHKTFQEYFAALFLATQPSCSNTIRSLEQAMPDLDSVLEMTKLLVFFCGMRPENTSELLDYIMETASADARIKRYRTFWFDTESDSLRLANRIQEIVFEILKEIENNASDIKKQRLDDLVIRKGSFTDFMAHSMYLKPECVRSIYFNSLTLKSKHISSVQNPKEIYSKLFESESLVKICILDSSQCVDSEVLCDSICNVSSQLTCIVIVSKPMMAIGQKIRDMLRTPLLVSLVLRDLTFTHEQLLMLAEGLSELTEVKQLNLSNLRCCDHKNNICRYSLDFTNMKFLEGLFMYELGVDKVHFNSKQLAECSIIAQPHTDFIRLLHEAQNLRKFICLGLHRPVDPDALVEVLPCLLSLKSMDIQTVDFGERSVRLSPLMSDLELVSLSNVAISDHSLRQFVDSLPMNGVTVYLHLNVAASDGAITTPDYIRHSSKFEVTKDFNIVKDRQIFLEFFTIGISDSDVTE